MYLFEILYHVYIWDELYNQQLYCLFNLMVIFYRLCVIRICVDYNVVYFLVDHSPNLLHGVIL